VTVTAHPPQIKNSRNIISESLNFVIRAESSGKN
jgi:hypothetical protein